jgi:hypothetical protein
MQQVTKNEFQNVALRREADRAASATQPSAPVELILEVLSQVGGGLTPNDTWSTASTPNDSW